MTESVEYHPEEYQTFSWLQERRARIDAPFENVTHLVAVDEQDVTTLKQRFDLPTPIRYANPRSQSATRIRYANPPIRYANPPIRYANPPIYQKGEDHQMSIIEHSESAKSSLPPQQVPLKVIRPSEGWVSLKLDELWRYRELLYFLIWRNYKLRYKQTLLGVAWAIIQPLFTMVIFSLFFGQLAQIPSEGVPYPIFSYAALVPWNFFANGLTYSSNGLVAEANLITKVYFPRLVIPIASVVSGLVDFVIAFSILWLMMLFYGIVPTINLLWLPFFLLLAVITSIAVGLWLAPINAQYRDVALVVPFMVQAWLFATPIAYPSSLLSEPWRTLYGINPMVGVVEGFRWALLGTDTAPGSMIIVSSVIALALLISGAYYFRRMERLFADVV